MKHAVYFVAPGCVEVREQPIPKPARDEVLVKTTVSAISAGTELLIYRGEVAQDLSADANLPALDGDLRFPLKYGYSAAGRVIGTGTDVDSSWLHQSVFAFQPHETHFVCRPDSLHRIPDGVTAEQAALLPNMETAVSFVMDGRPVIGERVVVFGLGIVGLLTTGLLARLPLQELISFDPHVSRRALSLEFGATLSFDPGSVELESQLDKEGADLAYELSGQPAALNQALLVTGYAGRVVVGSWYGTRPATLDLGGRFHRSRIRLISSQVSTLDPLWRGRWTRDRRLELTWKMLRDLKPESVVSHRIPISDAADAYRLLDRHPGEALQILLIH